MAPEKFKGGQFEEFYTPMNVGPKRGEPKGQPSVANVPVVIPPDPLGTIPGGKAGKGKGKKIGM